MRKNKRNCACVCASVRCLRVRFLLAEFLETSITAQSICSGASRLDGRQRHRKWMRQPHPPPTPKSPKKREMSRRISATANRPSSLSLPTMEREREREREPNPRRGRTRRNRGKTSFCCCCFFFCFRSKVSRALRPWRRRLVAKRKRPNQVAYLSAPVATAGPP